MWSQGFICGGGGGVLRIFERFEDSRELYKCSKVFRLNSPRPCTLITLAMSPSEDTLISATDTHQVTKHTNRGARDLRRLGRRVHVGEGCCFSRF